MTAAPIGPPDAVGDTPTPVRLDHRRLLLLDLGGEGHQRRILRIIILTIRLLEIIEGSHR